MAIGKPGKDSRASKVNNALSITPALFGRLISADKYKSTAIDDYGLMFRIMCISSVNGPTMEKEICMFTSPVDPGRCGCSPGC
jgi:hypothetical protein